MVRPPANVTPLLASLPVMVIGCLRVVLHIPHSGSLKEKRMVVRSLTARLRQTFNLAVAEVADQDSWQVASLGVACVSGDARHADEICQKALGWLDDNQGDAVLTESHFELVHV